MRDERGYGRLGARLPPDLGDRHADRRALRNSLQCDRAAQRRDGQIARRKFRIGTVAPEWRDLYVDDPGVARSELLEAQPVPGQVSGRCRLEHEVRARNKVEQRVAVAAGGEVQHDRTLAAVVREKLEAPFGPRIPREARP